MQCSACYVGCPHAGSNPVCLQSPPLVLSLVPPEVLQHILPAYCHLLCEKVSFKLWLIHWHAVAFDCPRILANRWPPVGVVIVTLSLPLGSFPCTPLGALISAFVAVWLVLSAPIITVPVRVDTTTGLACAPLPCLGFTSVFL